jgi:hypothetical protein
LEKGCGSEHESGLFDLSTLQRGVGSLDILLHEDEWRLSFLNRSLPLPLTGEGVPPFLLPGREEEDTKVDDPTFAFEGAPLDVKLLKWEESPHQ